MLCKWQNCCVFEGGLEINHVKIHSEVFNGKYICMWQHRHINTSPSELCITLSSIDSIIKKNLSIT